MLLLLDKAFFVVHTLLIAFNLTGWIWRRTRLAHLITFGLTAVSWFVLGAFHGWGYCVCADWHFQVRRELGYDDEETSYLQLLASELFGVSFSREVSDWIAGIFFVLIAIAAATVWILDGRRKRFSP
jgi:hypothetical protein